MGKQGAIARMVFAGDVAMETADPATKMHRIAPYFRDSAIAFCNCEWPLTTRGEPWPGKPGRVVRSRPDLVSTYTMCGFDVVSLANNHIMNYGPEGLKQTIEVLDAAGIAHSGAGGDLEAAHAPAILERGGKRYAFLSYTSVFNPGFEAAEDRPGMAVVKIDTAYRIPKRLHEVPGTPMEMEMRPNARHVERLIADIARARAAADCVVVSWHWGVSLGYQHLVSYQIELGRLAIDEGADVVVGHHPHTVQGLEIHKGKPIAYCLGHCGFDMKSNSFTEESIVLELALTAQGLGPPVVRPLANSVECPELADGQKAARTIDWLARLSAPLGTTFEFRDGAGLPKRGAP